MEKRLYTFTPRPVELRMDGEKPVIWGYAAVFYAAAVAGTEYQLAPGFVERVNPGAFDRAIREKDDARALFNHSPGALLGRVASGTCRLAVDAVGLRYEIDPPNTATGAEVLELLRRKDLDGSSYSFDLYESDYAMVKQGDTWIREIHNITRLYDVGPVTFPAFTATTAQSRAADCRQAIAHAEQAAIAAAARARALTLLSL